MNPAKEAILDKSAGFGASTLFCGNYLYAYDYLFPYLVMRNNTLKFLAVDGSENKSKKGRFNTYSDCDYEGLIRRSDRMNVRNLIHACSHVLFYEVIRILFAIEYSLYSINKIDKIDVDTSADDATALKEEPYEPQNRVDLADVGRSLKDLSGDKKRHCVVKKDLILLISENPETADTLKQTLSTKYQCILANSMQHGLELSSCYIPDLIIVDAEDVSDYVFHFCQQVRDNQTTCHIPLVLLSNNTGIVGRIQGWQNLVDEHLDKSLSATELRIRVANLIRIRQILCRKYSGQPDQEIRTKVEYQTTRKIAVKSDTASDLKQQPPLSDSKAMSKQNQRFMEKWQEAVKARYADADLKMGELAMTLSVSDRQLVRKLKALKGVTPNAYLRSFRLQQAKSQLMSHEPVGNVAYNVGFSSHAYFSACFKAEFGMEPSVWVSQNVDS